MKIIFVKFIEFYQAVFSLILKNLLGSSSFCRFRPTCSQYAKMQIEKEGVIKGSFLALVRIIKCQPFLKAAYE